MRRIVRFTSLTADKGNSPALAQNKSNARTLMSGPEENHELPRWLIFPHVSAFCTSVRHLGHIVRHGRQWHAFDTTRPHNDGTFPKIVGTFYNARKARAAVEMSVLGDPEALSIADLAGE
jgi:hypothetical protein